MLNILSFLLALPLTAIILCITMPFVGVILWYRANYDPKSLALQVTDGEGQHEPPQNGQELEAGSPSSFFGMIKRVYRLETGFYKGIMPTLLTDITVVILTTPLYYGFLAIPHRRLLWGLGRLGSRVIFPNNHEPSFSLRLSALLLQLYLAPGVFFAKVLHVVVGRALNYPVRHALAGTRFSLPEYIAGVVVLVLTVALLTPLAVQLRKANHV
ncbi:hypothetical protein C8J57DRAFT_1212453 [Mycena rebaudengoi]|nr:hypothetical protein C8J57DRAFT_1212453 [Mycena rebaudengoi]